MALTEKEIARYKHPIAVPGMGVGVQEIFKQTRILVVGTGGLGCPVLQYLSLSGIGVIGIADYGVILEEDLHRQPIFQMQDLRKHKAKMASSRLWASNPWTKHYPLLLQVKPDNVMQLLQGFDLVIDCSQHLPTHLVINDACVVQGVPFITGEVHNWVSWFGGFNMPDGKGGRTASYRCAAGTVDGYRNYDAGSLGATHGLTGLGIVNEVIKYLAGVPGGLAGRLYHYDHLHNSVETHGIVPDEAIILQTQAHGLLTAAAYGLEIVPDVED
ncbi:adenylyltransferase and sulfurtransferase [Chitinophaga costaii]|uniref:Adenylyltransferase and sulfurtransferase n=1 Tax=Chitinophaga costaii TaxID=1335309 RepID=A0A1C4BPA7_9BACT|nr:HesA/MoeB/ThiF family protein [Chitinophaga costaii]PUZ27530.1 HesA/MoeB/ThiF family protein [Chitinophaga costaii]SCC08568.1 adenylyltransferase and sulfurtransferase [Chitinophaga costaii]